MARIIKISVRVTPQATIVDLEGAVDIGNSHELRNVLFEALPTTPRLALNLSGVRYIDSSGIATLLEVLSKARSSPTAFVLFGLGPAVYDVLKLTKLLKVFQVFDSEGAAVGDAAPQ